ncbi:MAG: protoporphyrinogen/coproporphyrinogen oxidase [Solirubrobacteraceae bacterium]
MSADLQGRIVIIGAGPCGLACARELERLGHRDWVILEREVGPGGLAASVMDPSGFTWDLGGHVVFSHFGEFDALLSDVMNGEINHHDRSSYVRYGDRWVPYPFQNNLRHLPGPVIEECLSGLERAAGANPGQDFATWMRSVFGEGITRHFMRPYNFKVWATPGELMSSQWIGERVSVIDYQRVLANIREGRDDVAWGPNNAFVFPARGGTGEIYRRVAAALGPDRIRYACPASAVDVEARTVRIADGEDLAYDKLVSTMPLDRLVSALEACPDSLRTAAGELRHNSVYMVGVGYEAPLRDQKSWMYFPDPGVPFYRATNFAKYAAANVPGADTGRYCSYMTETAFSEHKPLARTGLEEHVEAGLRAAGVIDGRPELATMHVERIDYAYPVPTLGRDPALAVIQPWLMDRGICSRGRFGAWRYEAGNMDHAVKMGIDAARRLITGSAEELWRL